jgi:TonB-linked SusC/RagA family outer membrane protein
MSKRYNRALTLARVLCAAVVLLATVSSATLADGASGSEGRLHSTAGSVDVRQGTVTGVVTDANSGQPVANTQVYLDNTQFSAVTNEQGRYLLVGVPSGTYMLVVQMLGYGTQRRENVHVRDGEITQVDVQVTITALRLQEIVVTGVSDPTVGVNIPFTVAKVNVADLPVAQSSTLGAIQGRVAGARLIRNDGQPGADYNIILRTPTSINKSTSPLIVVDGVPMAEGASLMDLGGADVESIDIVKGAAGASLYGSRAANGVIQVRTKRGSDLARGTQRFSFRSEWGTEELPPDRKSMQIVSKAHPYLVNDKGEFVDEDGNLVARDKRVRNKYGIANTPYAQTFDHIDQVFKRGTTSTNTLSMSQNLDDTRFYVAATNFRQTGIVKENDGFTRRNILHNVDHRPTSKLSIGVSGNYSLTEQEVLPDPNPLNTIFYMPPDADLTAPNDDGTMGNGPYKWLVDPTILEENPLYLLYYTDRTQNRSRFSGNVTSSYEPTNWLRFEGDLSLDRSEIISNNFWPIGFKNAYHTTRIKGQITRSATSRQALNGGFNVRLLHRIGDLTVRNHARWTFEAQDLDSTSATGTELAIRNARSLQIAQNRSFNSSTRAVRAEGYYVSTGLNYADKLIGDFLVRRDGSSLFGPDDRWNTYYRAAGSYRMAQEEWFPLKSQLTEFKLHASLGTAGGRPSFADRFETWGVSAGKPVKSSLGNRLLRPEKATEFEYGVLAVLQDKYSLEITRADTKVEDQLVSIPLPSVVGYTSQWQNAGTLEGNTWEVELRATLLARPGLAWSAGVNWDRSRHKITELDRACYNVTWGNQEYGTYRRCAGMALGAMWGSSALHRKEDLPAYHANSWDYFDINDEGYLVAVGVGNTWRDGIKKDLWGTQVEVDGKTYQWGETLRLRDENGDLIQGVIANAEPDFRWSLFSDLRWRNWEFGGLLDAQVGGAIYNSQRQWAHRDGNHVDFDQTGKSEETQKTMPYVQRLPTKHFIDDASYVKLRELAVRYRFSPELVGRVMGERRNSGISVALTGRNLYTWTKYFGWDPEVGDPTSSATLRGVYPQLRTISLSFQVDF